MGCSPIKEVRELGSERRETVRSLSAVGVEGWAVRPLKRYASWVQNVVRQFGPYPLWALEI